MPTGSGKTAVLMAVPYILQSRRTLVLTPSRLVREQIARDFSILRVLRALGAVADGLDLPSVGSVKARIQSAADWDALAAHDVVVGIPASMSPEIEGIPAPPRDLFDLILVDEAHHSAADTWRALLRHFAPAQQALFTATPFRRDRRELLGRFVYNYALRDALRDGVFGQLQYQPVMPGSGIDQDLALATAAAAALRQDQAQGLNHRILVRTGSKTKAEALRQLYEGHTDLRLETVLGHHSLRHLERAIRRLRDGELDGLLCVDMLGEGVDLPLLKVAALHTPHRSLAVTLQFIGRFARTTGENLGGARFLAIASDMAVEREKLYRQGAVWNELVPNLSGARVDEEHHTREILETFTAPEAVEQGAGTPTGNGGTGGEDAIGLEATTPIQDLSLHVLKPFHHVKILRAVPGVDVLRPIEFPPDMEVVLHRVSPDTQTSVYITRQVSRPDWATVEYFDGVQYDLFVIHHHAETDLLFICASRRVDQVYQHLSRAFAPAGMHALRGLSIGRLNQVLLGLKAPRFFHIGKKKARAAKHSVSYETLAGPAADRALAQGDGRTHRRGHWFCSALQGDQNQKVTIGLSSASKVWSNAATRIPQLLQWCDVLAKRIADPQAPRTDTGLDFLGTGMEASSIPPNTRYAVWTEETFRKPPRLRFTGAGGAVKVVDLLDLDVEVTAADADSIVFTISGSDLCYRAVFSYRTASLITLAASNVGDVVVLGPRDVQPFLHYLNERPPLFYTDDFSCLDCFTLYATAAEDVPPFDIERLEVLPWKASGCDIANECGATTAAGRSIHSYLGDHLVASDADVVYLDHGPGEVADYLTIKRVGGRATIALYHCKGSTELTPGERVADAYDVTGQIVKCAMAYRDRRRLWEAVHHRHTTISTSTFLKGGWTDVDAVLGDSQRIELSFELVVVQPGFSKKKLTAKLGSLLASVDAFIVGEDFARLRVLASE
jgi:superfamily II DNA or RNA helicase